MVRGRPKQTLPGHPFWARHALRRGPLKGIGAESEIHPMNPLLPFRSFARFCGEKEGKMEVHHLRLLKPGERLRLKEGALRHVKTREWIFQRIEDEALFLVQENGYYGVFVQSGQIDWQEYHKQKDRSPF
jgi:hypothetical protein